MCAQEASGKFIKAVYIRLPELQAGEDGPVQIPDVRLPFRGRVVLCPPGASPPRCAKALVFESGAQFVGQCPSPFPRPGAPQCCRPTRHALGFGRLRAMFNMSLGGPESLDALAGELW
jgi:hypothetical protein